MQAEVKKFLNDPHRGRPSQQMLEPGLQAPDDVAVEDPLKDKPMGDKGRKLKDESGKTIDIVLSDMSAPWEQTSGFWKRSLSNPYRMMNTSGIPFRDHTGSMVRVNFIQPLASANTSEDLCNAALEFSYDTLKTGGHFVCKFYQGAEDKQLENRLKKLFGAVHREKPESSRSVCTPKIPSKCRAYEIRNQKRHILWHYAERRHLNMWTFSGQMGCNSIGEAV